MKTIIVLMPRSAMSFVQAVKLMESLKTRGFDVIGVYHDDSSQPPVQILDLTSLPPKEIQEIKDLVQKVIR